MSTPDRSRCLPPHKMCHMSRGLAKCPSQMHYCEYHTSGVVYKVYTVSTVSKCIYH